MNTNPSKPMSYTKPFYLLSPQDKQVIKVTEIKPFLNAQPNLTDADYFAICALKALDNPKKSHKGWRLCDKDGNNLKPLKSRLNPFYLLSPNNRVVRVENVTQFVFRYRLKESAIQAIYFLKNPSKPKWEVNGWRLCDKDGNILKHERVKKRVRRTRSQIEQAQKTEIKTVFIIKERQVVDPNGVKHSFSNMKAFTEEHNLNYQCFCKFLNGKIKSYKGWRRLETD